MIIYFNSIFWYYFELLQRIRVLWVFYISNMIYEYVKKTKTDNANFPHNLCQRNFHITQGNIKLLLKSFQTWDD